MDTELEILIRAIADEKSADEATKQLVNRVFSKLKDGAVKLPINSELDKSELKKLDDNVKQARKEVVRRYNKLQKEMANPEGFDAFSDKAINELVELGKAYATFNSKASGRSKNSIKAVTDVKTALGDVFQLYENGIKLLNSKIKELDLQDKVSKNLTTTRSKRRGSARNFGPHSKAEIDANIEQENKRRYKGLKYTGPKPPRTGWINPGATNPYQAKLSEISGYRSGFASQTRRSEKEFYKDPAHQSKTSKPDKEEFEKIWNDVTSKSKQLSEVEKAKGLSKTLTDKILPKLINDILLNRDAEGSAKQFSDTAEAIYKLSETAGINQYDTAKKEVDSVMRKFFNVTGKVGGTDGTDKTAGLNNEVVKTAIKDLFAKIEKKMDVAIDEIKSLEKTTKTSAKQKTATKDANTFANKIVSKLTANDQTQTQTSQAVAKAVEAVTDATEVQTNYDKIENASERVADSKEDKANREAIDTAKLDASTGFNAEEKTIEMFAHQTTTNRLLGEIKDLLTQIFGVTDGKIKTQSSDDGSNGEKRPPIGNTSDNADGTGGSYQGILLQITQHLKNIDVNVGNILQSIITQTGKIPNNLPAIIDGEGVKTHPVEKEPITDKTNYNLLHDKKVAKEVETERTAAIVHNAVQKYVEEDRKKSAQEKINEEAAKKATGGIDMSEVITSTPGFFGKLQDLIRKNLSSTIEADRIMSMNKEEQMRARAQRMEIFGENRGRSLTDTGDKAGVKRTKQLFGWIYKKDGANKELLQDIQLTPGFNRENTIDTTKILGSLNKVLSGPEMFKAQTGGALRNLVGSFTGYLGMPSLEKSRAEAEGLNQIMANVRNEVLKLVQSIQSKEMALKGMQDMGTAKFDSEGRITEDSSSIAQKTFIDLEEQKGVLRSALAEVSMIDDVVGQTGGKIHDIIKNLGFVMPELMENNTILQNINAGLDKNGKALKFQTRTGEVLNYSFQLLSRHIGQLVKNWMMMANPINLIKKAFSDFASYDVKWQRTMNVIKYNIRRIIRPFMEWLAQQFVNIIGLVNALLKGVGSALGENWDLFDKDAANAEKIREELEAASNVSAGFDELHDIGSDNTGANDLSGDIYTPQWDGLNSMLEKVGETIGKIIDAVSHFTFWDWLILAGTALIGFVALKTLINWFTGKNPLESVAKGFKTLQTTVGWAILIASFGLFVKILSEFIETVGKMEPDEVWQAFAVLAASFGILVVAIGLLMGAVKLFKTDFLSSLGLSAIITAFALLTAAIAYFIDTVSKIDNVAQVLQMLSGILLVVVGVVTLLLAVFTALIATGVGAAAVFALAEVLGAVALVIAAMALLVVALGEYSNEIIAIMQTAGAIIIAVLQTIVNGIQQIILTVVLGIVTVITTIGNTIVMVIQGVANVIMTVLQPIMDFVDSIIGKVVDLAKTIAHEIGETIRTIIETIGEVVLGIINAIVNAIPNLLDSIIDFINELGPAINNFVDGFIQAVTKMVNFAISAFEFILNIGVDVINGLISAANTVPGVNIGYASKVEIKRFEPASFAVGTNYVPNDGLAYLHQGEAVIPKKYNQPYQPGTLSPEEKMYMNQMMNIMKSLDSTMKQGINVNGQFVQRGSDLVAVVNKTKSQSGADLLSNVAYAR